MEKSQRAATFAVVVVVSVATIAIAESKKEFRFTVGPHANVTVMNQFGPISLKPGSGNLVIVTATTHSDKVEVDQSQMETASTSNLICLKGQPKKPDKSITR